MLTLRCIEENYDFLDFERADIGSSRIRIPQYVRQQNQLVEFDPDSFQSTVSSFQLEYHTIEADIYSAPIRDPYYMVEFEKYLSETIKHTIFKEECDKIFFTKKDLKNPDAIIHALIEKRRFHLYNAISRYERAFIIVSQNIWHTLFDNAMSYENVHNNRCTISKTGQRVFDFPVYVDNFSGVDYLIMMPQSTVSGLFKLLYKPIPSGIKFCLAPTEYQWQDSVTVYHQDVKQDLMLQPLEDDTSKPDNFFLV